MIVYDPLYGRFQSPGRLLPLLLTPEVRRLSQIRLLNTLTPSLSTLGDLRRYSHTLGVLYLAQTNSLAGYTPQERAAFAASVIIHDIGTPPFGHLMEYHLKEIAGWSHEDVIRAILWGHHAPENRAHQIFAGRPLGVRAALRRARVSLDLVQAIITRQHPLSALLFGSIDFDNLDNVLRMAWALGLQFPPAIFVDLARGLSVSRDGTLQLSEARHRESIERWAELRRQVYEIVAFDPETVAQQAVLSEAIAIALRAGLLTETDWALYDELLIERLRSSEKTKLLVSRDYLGQPPKLIYAVQLVGELSDYNLKSRSEAKILLDRVLADQFGMSKALGYVFVDKGAFEKRLEFRDIKQDAIWEVGRTSRSVILYAFLRASTISKDQAAVAVNSLTKAVGISGVAIARCLTADSNERDKLSDQPQLTLPAF
jgi:HD superfamily phosphohydrolase